MAVIKEYKCLAHGDFDSTSGVCPHGCTTVVRAFRTAPGGRSDKTKRTDATLERLADRFNLTDMSNRNGSVGNSRKQVSNTEALWGALPKGNAFHVGSGEVPVEGSQGGAMATIGGAGESMTAQMEKLYPGQKFEPEQSFSDIAKTLPRVRPKVAASFGTSVELDTEIRKTS